MRHIGRHTQVEVGVGVDVIVHDLDGRVVLAIRQVAGAQVGAEDLALPACRGVQAQFGHAQTEGIALGTNVLDLGHAIIGGQAVGPGADQTQIDATGGVHEEAIQRCGVGNLGVNAIGLVLSQIEEGGHGANQVTSGIAFNLVAQGLVTVKAAGHQILGRDGGDHVIDLDAVIIDRHVQTGHRRRRIGEAQR
ncbi:hypothetical protein D3C75_821220 [compost metagenome]